MKPGCSKLSHKSVSLTLCLSAFLILFSTTQISAQTPVPGIGSGFEIDGNLFSQGKDDWVMGASGNGVLDSAGNPIDAVATIHVIDLTGNADLDVFAQSDKVFHDPNTYNWKAGSVPQKDDINNGLFHVRTDSVTGDLWVTMSGDRRAVNGDSYIDFELLQSALFMNSDGTFTSLGPDGGRTLGDLLLTIEFIRGGGQPQFFVQSWQVDPSTSSGFNYIDISPPPGLAFISANLDSTVTVPYEAFGDTTYQINAFAEAAINISAAVPNFDTCFGATTLFIRTKSSQSSSAQLKDLIAPIQLRVCLDNAPPVLVGCPADTTLECTDSIPPPANVTAIDACDTLPIVTFTQDSIPNGCPVSYTLIRKWFAEDECGNIDSCMQTIVIEDNTPPVLSCPANVNVQCASSSDT
ncbi:MAG: hypothetical protein IIB00_09010, partial [candidate division Zixibacteria bacterium]|nr:hypothetical protein [candidate division Zixibacteria bacterium]